MKEKLIDARDYALDNIDIIANGILTVVIAAGCYICYSQGTLHLTHQPISIPTLGVGKALAYSVTDLCLARYG
jgi:divalent metal cation (Fe/Co/Zn/Cd) transporter